MESHAVIKDECDNLEYRLEDIANDIRGLPFNYKIVETYTSLDEQLYEIQEWYQNMKEFIRKYEQERLVFEERLKNLQHVTKSLDNQIQNLKLQAFSRGQHADVYSQSPNNRHL